MFDHHHSWAQPPFGYSLARIHPSARLWQELHRLKLLVIGSAVALLAACGGSPGQSTGTGSDGSGGSTASPAAVRALSVSTFGSSGMGQFREFAADDLDTTTRLLDVAGLPWVESGGDEDHTVSFNPVDRKFYAVIPAAHLKSPALSSHLLRFDPVSDQVEYLGRIRAAVVNASAPATATAKVYKRSAVFSRDGKSMMMVASLGGRTNRSGREATGDGALVHVNLDASSPGYLAVTSVYEMAAFDQRADHALRNVLSEPLLAYDTNGQATLYLLAMGERYTLTSGPSPVTVTVPARAFTLQPGNASDWSQPWHAAGVSDEGSSDFWGTGRFGTRMALSPSGELSWLGGDTTLRGAGFGRSAGGTSHWQSATVDASECVNPVGMVWVSSRFFAMCMGYDDYHYQRVVSGSPSYFPDSTFIETPGRIMEYSRGDNLFVSRNSFSVFDINDTKALAMSPVADTGRIYLNVGKRSGDLWLSEMDSVNETLVQGGFAPIAFPNSSLQMLDTAFWTVQSLVTGNADIGRYFVGAPAIGGDGVLPDRWIVTLARYGGANGVSTIVKHDRVTGQTTAVPLGIAPGESALPVGQPLVLADGRVLGQWLAGALEQGAEALGTAYGGFYVADAETRRPGSVRRLDQLCFRPYGAGTTYTDCPQLAMGYAQTDTGEIWASAQSGRGGTQVYRVNPETGGMDLQLVLAPEVAADSANPHLDANQLNGYVASALGPHVLVIAQRSSTYSGVTLVCLGDDQQSQRLPVPYSDQGAGAGQVDGVLAAYAVPGRTNHYEFANDPVRGGTALDGRMYLVTRKVGSATEGRIHELDMSTCNTDHVARISRTLVTGLTSIPSTRLTATTDRRLVYGTEDGKLMSFDPVTATVTQLKDLTLAGGQSAVTGYLSDVDGQVMGYVRDTDANGRTHLRLFAYGLADGGLRTRAADEQLDDPYPGVVALPAR